MINFFNDKGEEYQTLINRQEFLGYIKAIKIYGNEELYKDYKSELGELMPAILKLIQV